MRPETAIRKPIGGRVGIGGSLAHGKAPVRVAPSVVWWDVVEGLISTAREAARGEIGAMALEVFENAARKWPVDTGYSRSRLELRRLDDGGAGLGERHVISVDAWYAGYIKSGEDHIVSELLVKPISAAIQKAAERTAEKVS